MSLRQIPNLVTLSRLFLAVAAFVFFGELTFKESLGAPETKAAFYGFWCYLAAVLTDTLDGFLARRFGWVTRVGRIADPVVDKVLTLGALVYLACTPALAWPGDIGPLMPPWAVVVILAREFLVTAIRGLVESSGHPFPADGYGKVKMVLQSVYVLVLVGVAGGIPSFLGLEFLELLRHPLSVQVLFWSVVSLTAASGVVYLLKAARLLSGASPR
ncbi:MAG TPA: hypothetical protein DDW23_00065 [Planctomycetes bacterium]|nr:hypothetical protein [Planctomycetota bacterium]